MLAVQEYLKTKTLEDLNAELGINAKLHDSLPLVILNYDQIESHPKTHPIVRECRSLVLDTRDWSVVAKSFTRFFNWGEVQEEMSSFDFGDFIVQSKEDGSLILIYWFDGQWHINTRGTFGGEKLEPHDMTWREGILKALGISSTEELDKYLNRSVSYACEFCSTWNKVVRRYEKPKVYLLSAFNGVDELHWTDVDKIAVWAADIVSTPTVYCFRSIEEIQKFLDEQSAADPTFEGVVIRDRNNNRWKIKSATYLGLHKLRGESNIWNPKHLLPFILSGEESELLTYYPEAKEVFYELKADVSGEYARMLEVWNDHKAASTQKDFALGVKDTPFSSVLFQIRRKFGPDAKSVDIRSEWKDSDQMILKRIRP